MNLDELITDTVEIIENKFKQNDISFKKELNLNFCPLTINTDPLRLKQVLMNLLSNSIKYTKTKGVITLSVGLKTENLLEFTVSDTGVGMSKEI